MRLIRGFRNSCVKISFVLGCMRCELLHYSVAHSRGLLIRGCIASLCVARILLQNCRIIRDEPVAIWLVRWIGWTRHEVVALVGWRATRATSQCHQRALLVFLERSLAKWKPTTPSTLPVVDRVFLSGRFYSTLFTANNVGNCCFLIRNPGRCPVGCNSESNDNENHLCT